MSDPTVLWPLAAAFLVLTFALVGVVARQPRPATVLTVAAVLCAFGACGEVAARPAAGQGGWKEERSAINARRENPAMNIETIDIASLRLPRAPRRPVGQRDERWIEQTLSEIGSDAVSSMAAPDRLAAPNGRLYYDGRCLKAA